MYKYTKIQGPRFQRNYIIARDQRSDLHGTSFQSLPKITACSSQDSFAYSESLQHLIIAVLLIKILIFFRPLRSVHFLSKEIMSKMPCLLLYRNHYFCLYLLHRMMCLGLMRSPGFPVGYYLQLFQIAHDLWWQKCLWILGFSVTSIKIWRIFSPSHLSSPLI